MQSIKQLTPFLSVSEQLQLEDIGGAAALGFKTVINNRPDGESSDQPTSEHLAERCRELGLAYYHLPVVSGQVSDADVVRFREILAEAKGPAVAFCRTGNRSVTLWALSEASHLDPEVICQTTATAGYDLSALEDRLRERWYAIPEGGQTPARAVRRHDVVIVGGGAAGLAAAASLLKRRSSLDIVVVEPRDQHYYQPGWTLVGAGVFDRNATERPMASIMPKGVKHWIKAAVAAFEPDHQAVVLEDGERIGYRVLIVAPGIQLNWDAIEGLSETLGKNGVTSNYRFDMAPYTRELVQGLQGGRALFTQPPMPIKCAGAPQKAMYLSCDYWLKHDQLKQIEVEFHTAGSVLFGVEAFVPPLMDYVKKYNADLCFSSNLVAVDGFAKKAWFEVTDKHGEKRRVEKCFTMLHVCPPQSAPDFVSLSPLADASGWVDVSPETLRHNRFGNIFSLGDASSAPNAKTAAAVRKQAPVVAENVLAVLDGRPLTALYDGYGSCPLTVERGKVVLAEFGYGGKLLPSFPLNPTVPRRIMWLLKTQWMPYIYFDLMLKGREWLASPMRLRHAPTAHEVQPSCDYAGKS